MASVGKLKGKQMINSVRKKSMLLACYYWYTECSLLDQLFLSVMQRWDKQTTGNRQTQNQNQNQIWTHMHRTWGEDTCSPASIPRFSCCTGPPLTWSVSRQLEDSTVARSSSDQYLSCQSWQQRPQAKSNPPEELQLWLRLLMQDVYFYLKVWSFECATKKSAWNVLKADNPPRFFEFMFLICYVILETLSLRWVQQQKLCNWSVDVRFVSWMLYCLRCFDFILLELCTRNLLGQRDFNIKWLPS